MNDENALAVQQFRAGVARLRRAFTGAGLKRSAKNSFSALALAASIWGELAQKPGDFVDVVLTGLGHAARELKKKFWPSKLPAYVADARIVQKMRALAGTVGRLEALMLSTIAVEDLWQLCALTEAQAEAVAHGALRFATREGLADRVARARGTLPTGGGDA